MDNNNFQDGATLVVIVQGTLQSRVSAVYSVRAGRDKAGFILTSDGNLQVNLDNEDVRQLSMTAGMGQEDVAVRLAVEFLFAEAKRNSKKGLGQKLAAQFKKLGNFLPCIFMAATDGITAVVEANTV